MLDFHAMRFLFFVALGFLAMSSFSSENLLFEKPSSEGAEIFKNIKDISFQAVREPISLERILADPRQSLVFSFLLWLQHEGDDKWITAPFTSSWLSNPKKTAFDFLLMEESLQKKTLKEFPALIKKLITAEIQAKDFLMLQGIDPNLEEVIRRLPPEESLVYMPHLILSWGDRDIIRSVFQTKGFDPYFRTSLGNNLFHSFVLFGRLEKILNDNIEKGSYKKALQLLIEKSPPALLTQKNAMGLTPLVWAAFLDDSISYKLFMKAMDSKDVLAEIPSLEREILSQGFYHLLPSLNEFLFKFDKQGGGIDIGEEGRRIFMSFNNFGKKSAGRAGFMLSDPQHSIVKFNFKNLISQSRFTDFIKHSFNESQKYEKGRISEIAKIFNNPDLKEIQDIQLAVSKRDLKALKQSLRNVADASAHEKLRTVQMVLEESIRSQFEVGVLTAVRIMNDTELIFYDPIFLALLNYVSLDKRHPRKEAAKKIIRILAKRQTKEAASAGFFWSIFFGLPEELEFFVEEIGVPLDPFIVDQGLQYALQEDHVKIFNYLSQSLKKDPNAMFSCKDIFVN